MSYGLTDEEDDIELLTGECLFCGNIGTFGYDLQRVTNTTFGIKGEDILHTDCIESFKLELTKL
jgi:hypothetical protein